MLSHSLFGPFLEPIVDPIESYTAGSNVVAYRFNEDGLVVQEIFQRPNKTLGFQYIAWVAWRDAGDEIRSHSWHEISADDVAVVDEIDAICRIAETDAITKKLRMKQWVRA